MKKILISTGSLLTLLFVQLQLTASPLMLPDKQHNKEMREERRLKRMEAYDANYLSKQAFYNDFENTSLVHWSHNDACDEAHFVKDGIDYTAFYDTDSKLIGTTCIKTEADLPASALKKINTKYKGWTLEKVIYYEDKSGTGNEMVIFGDNWEGSDFYFAELVKDNHEILVQISTDGSSRFFKTIS